MAVATGSAPLPPVKPKGADPSASAHASAAAPQVTPSATKGRGALQQTLLGMAPMAGAAAVPVEKPRPADAGSRTLIGVPPSAAGMEPRSRGNATPLPGSTSAGVPQTAPDGFGADAERAPRPGSFEPVRNAATILGGTLPIPMPSPAGAENATRRPDVVASEPAAAHAAPLLERTALAPDERLPREQAPPPAATPMKTALGVALPGIAPLRPGVSAAPPPAPAAETRPLLEETRVQPEAMSTTFFGGRVRTPRSALVLLISGAVLLLAAVAFALLWRGSSPLSAIISADPSGKDRIDIVCESCPDGTVLRSGSARAEVQSRKAYLILEQQLPLGENTLEFQIETPGEGTDDTTLTLPPLEYRIRPDTSTLVGDQPRLSLAIQALPGSRAEIGGAAVELDPSGAGLSAIDVTDQLKGPASEVTTFERAVPYVITPPSGKRYAGELQVKIGVTPLLLEAPGADTITNMERFMLAGRTTKGAEVSVAGSTLSVNASGRFAQLMSIDAVGESNVTVRASQAGLAPRFVSFRLRRVKDLQSELDALRSSAVSLAKVSGDVDGHLGRTVVASGKVEEVRVDGQRAFIVLATDEECGGRFCLARLVYGGLRKLERGASITAAGRVLGSVGVGSERVVEIDVSLLR